MTYGGSMLVVIKEVLPSEKWVAEPKLLQMMHNRGLVTAQRRDFGVFFRKHAGLLDRMMSGTGTEEKGFACIFVNISANEAVLGCATTTNSRAQPLRYVTRCLLQIKPLERQLSAANAIYQRNWYASILRSMVHSQRSKR